MNTNLNTSSVCYGLFQNNNMIAFCSVLHFPHPKAKNIKRVHRLVVLPDYQGIGLGSKFETFIANLYKAKGFRFRIITSAKNLIMKKAKSKEWKCTEYITFAHVHSKTESNKFKGAHRNVKTASFEFVGK